MDVFALHMSCCFLMRTALAGTQHNHVCDVGVTWHTVVHMQVFKKVDYNKNGLIEPLEVEVAILSL